MKNEITVKRVSKGVREINGIEYAASTVRPLTKQELRGRIKKRFAEQGLKIWTDGYWLLGNELIDTNKIHCQILIGISENLPITREAIVKVSDFASLNIINIDVRFHSGQDICEHIKSGFF